MGFKKSLSYWNSWYGIRYGFPPPPLCFLGGKRLCNVCRALLPGALFIKIVVHVKKWYFIILKHSNTKQFFSTYYLSVSMEHCNNWHSICFFSTYYLSFSMEQCNNWHSICFFDVFFCQFRWSNVIIDISLMFLG